MHQSFPLGLRSRRAFNFSVCKALLNTLHSTKCRNKFMVKFLLKALASQEANIFFPEQFGFWYKNQLYHYHSKRSGLLDTVKFNAKAKKKQLLDSQRLLSTRIPRKASSTCWGKSHRSHNQNGAIKKFISFLAVLTWKTGLKKNVDKVPSGAHIFQASPIPSNGYIFSTDFLYYTAQ